MSASDFDNYFALREKGALREACDVLRHILECDPRLSKVGDLYVWCAELGLMVNDDAQNAQVFLDKARELGCQNMAYYHSVHGYLLCRTGELSRGIEELEKSVALNPSITHLTTLAEHLSGLDAGRARDIWHQILQRDPDNCMAHIYLSRDANNSGDKGKALLLAKRSEKLARSALEFFEIGRLYHDLSEFECSVHAYLEADKLGWIPKGPLYAAIAACYFSLGDNSMGRKYLAWAMKHSPEHEYVKDVLRRSQAIEGGDVNGVTS